MSQGWYELQGSRCRKNLGVMM